MARAGPNTYNNYALLWRKVSSMKTSLIMLIWEPSEVLDTSALKNSLLNFKFKKWNVNEETN